jgi:predicted membrane chloride channel (bestrophin family)
LTAWLLLLPLAMYESFAQNRLLLIPTSAFISFFFFGIDELAIQLEEPFSILPLEYSCANIKQMAKQAVLWHAKAQ